MHYVLLLSGGIGVRLGTHIPKQYIQVNDKMVIEYSLETFFSCAMIDRIQVVAEEAWWDAIRGCFEKSGQLGRLGGFSEPGKNRQMSILHGLRDMREYVLQDDAVMIHDAARPMLSEQMIGECYAAIKGHDGVIPVLPMKDTVYLSKDGSEISGLLRREEVFAGQAPEVFRFGKYLEANETLCPERILTINGSTEPAIMAGMKVAMIPGDERNFKITTEEDLERFRGLMKR